MSMYEAGISQGELKLIAFVIATAISVVLYFLFKG